MVSLKRGVSLKIASIDLKNVKCFDKFHLDLVKPETEEVLSVCALVGRNGSGKSTILKSIVSVFTVFNQQYNGEIFDDSAIYKGETYLTCKINMALNEEEQKRLNPQHANTFLRYIHTNKNTSLEDTGGHECKGNFLAWISKDLEQEADVEFYNTFFRLLNEDRDKVVIMYFDPFRFLTNHVPSGPNLNNISGNPIEDALASNISIDGMVSGREISIKQWFVNLDYIRLKEPTEKNEQIYKHMVSAFELLLSPLVFKGINVEGSIIFIDKENDKEIEIDMLSDGFKSIFLIISEIMYRLSLLDCNEEEYFYNKEAIILIDEIDCHIHPRWQRNLIPSLRKLFPNCQFIVTTHSPFILETLQEYEIKQIGEKGIM